MNWLTNYVKPKLRKLVGGRTGTQDNLWKKCPECGQMIFHRELEKNLSVCQHCGYHMRISAQERLKFLYDNGEYLSLPIKKGNIDPIKFRDRKKYTDRLKEAQLRTGESDAIMVAVGKMGGKQVVSAATNFGFMGGSMGVAVGNGIIQAAQKAVELSIPLIVFPSSGGARMQEGIFSLMQLVRTTLAVEELKNAGLPYIVVLCDPTSGGVSASFAMLGDIQIAEPGAIIGFAGKRVIEQTIREKLPEGFQRSEYLLEHGMIDMVVERRNLRDMLVRITSLLIDPLDDKKHRNVKERDKTFYRTTSAGHTPPPDVPAPKSIPPIHSEKGIKNFKEK